MSGGPPQSKPLSLGQVLEEEFELLHRQLPAKPPQEEIDDIRLAALREQIHALEEKPTALCLSGGGIRSATFALGVLQGLSRIGWLERFHYLSTVSGGGYVGSWLSSWIARSTNDPALPLDGLKCAVEGGTPVRAEPPPIRWLRMYSSYLSPKRGLSVDLLTLITTFLRNLLLNWIVLVPLIAALLILPRINIAMLHLNDGSAFAMVAFAAAAALGAFGIAYAMSDLPGKGTCFPTANHFVPYCLLPLTLAIVLLSWAWSYYPPPNEDRLWWLACVAATTLVHGVGIIGGLALRAYRRVQVEPDAQVPPLVWQVRASVAARQAQEVQPSRLDIGLILVSGPATGAVLALVSTHAARWLANPGDTQSFSLYATLAVPALLGCAWLWIATYVAWGRRFAAEFSEDDREWWGRASAYILAVAATWILINGLLIFVLDWLSQKLSGDNAAAGSVTGLLSGLITAIIGYYNGSGRGVRAEREPGAAALTGRTLLNLGAVIFIVALLLGLGAGESALLGKLLPHLGVSLDGSATADAVVLERTPVLVLVLAFILLIGLATGVSVLTGANTFSLHGMYGNRLVRAYLGATSLSRRPHEFTGFNPGDNLLMRELKTQVEKTRRLLHVINVTLNIVQGARLEWQQRKAESFTISPLHCGSLEVGYRPTDDPNAARPEDNYAGGMTLGRALTISGAAASPNMGYHSSTLVTFVMAFFNVRLGWWLPNPGKAELPTKPEPPGVRALIDEALGRTNDRSDWVYLSDGGHFENLGLYEMVLRRCHKIVVVDGTADPDYQFEDLENAIRKIRTDLGIAIEFPHGLPKPQTASQRQIHYSIGRIPYGQADPGGVDGYIVYVKPVLSGDEPVDLRRYAETHNDRGNRFPHQSTADQFFDEAQFESYRELGLHSVLAGFPKWETWSLQNWEPPAPPLTSSTAAPLPEPPSKRSSWAGLLAAAAGAWPALLAIATVPPATALVVRYAAPAATATPTATPTATNTATPSPGTPTPATSPTGPPDIGVAVPPSGPQASSTATARIPAGSPTGSEPVLSPTPSTPVVSVPPSPPSIQPTSPSSTIPVSVIIQPAETGRVDRIMLPIFPEAKTCPRCEDGLVIDASSKLVLESLADVLVGCAKKGGAKVTVNVKGFASSSDFRRWPATGNVLLADARAERVAAVLNDGRDPARFEAIPYKWSGPEELKNARHYVDLDRPAKYWPARGVLNRRAEIIFPDQHLGGCDVEEVLTEAFPAWPIKQ